MIDWQTEEDDDHLWQAEDDRETGFRPGWLFWSIFSLLLMATGAWAGSQLYQRIENNLQSTRDDVRQQYLLTWQAAVVQDIDLFSHFLQASDLRWRVLQRLLLQEDLLYNKAPLNLWLDPSVRSDEIETAVWLSPDLTQAEVTTILPFISLGPANTPQQTRFRQISHYQYRNAQWVQVPLSERAGFWGEHLLYQGEQLEIIYPDRDKGIARRLAAELDSLLVALCADPRLFCEADGTYRVIFSQDETAVYVLSDNIRTQDILRHQVRHVPIYELTLPTPSLIGYPMDEASYEALYRGYASWVTAVFMQNLSDSSAVPYQDVLEELTRRGLPIPAVAGYHPLSTQLPPVPLPESPLLLTCADTASSPQSWLYYPQTDQWEQVGRPFGLTTDPERFQPTPTLPIKIEKLRSSLPIDIRPLQLELLSSAKYENTIVHVTQSSDAHPQLHFIVEEADQVLYFDSIQKTGDTYLPVELVANGRFLSVVEYNYARTNIFLLDTSQQLKTTRFTIDGVPYGRFLWTEDGRWFAMVEDRALRLVAPTAAYEHLVYHNIGGCTYGTWVR